MSRGGVPLPVGLPPRWNHQGLTYCGLGDIRQPEGVLKIMDSLWETRGSHQILMGQTVHNLSDLRGKK